MSGPSLSSFTPINASRAPVQFVNPQKTLHESTLDDDTSIQHTLEAVPLQKGKKRGTNQANKGRAISIGRVWEYRDDGDVAAQNQGPDFESSFPKRRKSAPVKRTKTTPGQPKNSEEFWEQASSHHALAAENDEEKQGSQLTTPPDSSRRGIKKTALKQRSHTIRTGHFRNPVITKPSVPCKIVEDEKSTPAQSVTVHRGWTTTEEAVKHKFSGISQTTLDKLAAFRYRSSAATQAELPASEGGSFRATHDSVGKPEEVPLSSDYGHFPSDDPVFNEGYIDDQESAEPARCPVNQSQQVAWTPDHLHGGDAFFNDAIWNVSVTVNADGKAHPSQTQLPIDTVTSPPQSAVVNAWVPASADGVAVPLLLASKASDAGLELSQNIFDYGDLSSSQLRESTGTSCNDGGVHRKEPTVLVINEPSDTLGNQATTWSNLECGTRSGGPQLGLGSLPNPSYEATADDPYQLNSHSQTDTQAVQTSRSLSRHLEHVQVERSDIDGPQMTPRDISHDFEVNEFDDEGIDDADLLAIVSEPAIPETQLVQTGKNNGSPTSESLRESQIRSRAHQPASAVAGDEQLVRCSIPSSPVILPDEEYLLGDGLEEEDMISLPIHLQGVIETFQAPPSLEYSFANGSMSGEVYDKSLQFSPPKSRPSSVLPGKPAGGSLTDGRGPSKTQRVEYLGSDPPEEEDWSFVRSNVSMANLEVPILSDPTSDQENVVLNKVAKPIIPLGPQKQRKHSTYANFQPAVQSSNTEEIKLDDSHDYKPLQPFARPDFPSVVLDRCPIIGVSAQSFLRVCFRVGEMFREGARCHDLKQDAVIELFARVTFSSREPGTTKQHFQFADLWHDRPPFPNGILANYKTSGLAESESRTFIGAEEHLMARCIGRMRRGSKNSTGWLMDIINIRPTDWEEIKWTKKIVSAGLVKSEKGAI
ncbi:hypothetical protein IFR04_014878 [Cadophora malorum]|uniref:Uncharacterized protein n=1 Tax=Cadophora malorum TaxID=108018 RepID=A0A8H7T2W4_9HELO|nr:hypothetical protein IFR04_014878 [Cadophora malorum]